MVSEQKLITHYFLKLCRCRSFNPRQKVSTHIKVYLNKVSHVPVYLIRGLQVSSPVLQIIFLFQYPRQSQSKGVSWEAQVKVTAWDQEVKVKLKELCLKDQQRESSLPYRRCRIHQRSTGKSIRGIKNWRTMLLHSLSQRVQKIKKPKVKCPQDLAFVGTLRRRPTYEQLSITQWLLGFLRIRQEETDPQIKEHMIEYLMELAQDACDYS